MKILIDLGHPAHIHYFKNFVSIMQQKGHTFAFVARDKEVLHTLLDHYNISYISRGQGSKQMIGKLFYILKADYIIYRVARRFKPDLFLSFASSYAAHAAKLYGKPHIALDDTEHATLELMLYAPFSDAIINPSAFWKKFSPKQLFINTFFELNYLAPKYFKPDADVLKKYDIAAEEIYFILRFVSWDASHDVGAKGISTEAKMALAEKLSAHGRVLISSEGTLPAALEKYRLRIDPVHLHHLLAFASLYVGEGATTASECVALGVPAIYINSLDAGTLSEQARSYGLISLRSPQTLNQVMDAYLQKIPFAKAEMQQSREKLLREKIDGTALLVWFIENYPQSKTILRDDPAYQYNFSNA